MYVSRDRMILLLTVLYVLCNLVFAGYAPAPPGPPVPPPSAPAGGDLGYGVACGAIALYGFLRLRKKK